MIDIDEDFIKLNELINEWYGMLYEGYAPVGTEDKRQAILAIEKFMSDDKNIPFLKSLFFVRHDCFTSDREYQALYFAMVEMNLI